jgi:prepilin-type processing-associated H-X9-DG protein
MYAVADSRTYGARQYGEKGIVGEISMNPYDDRPGTETAPLHGQGYNILFADGHVVRVSRRDCLYPPRTAKNWNRDNQPHQEAWAPTNYWVVQQ